MLAAVSWVADIEQVGTFGIAFTTAQLLYILGLFGVSHYQMTDYSGKYSFAEYLRVRCASGALMLVLGFIASLLLGFRGEKLLFTALLTVLMLLNIFGDLIQNLFFQRGRLDLSGSALFYRTVFSLLAFCLVLFFFKSITAAIIVQIILNLAITVYYAYICRRDWLSAEWRLEHGDGCVSVIRECFPLLVSTFLMNLIIMASKYGVELFMDDAAQGYYNLIFMPAQVINLISQFIFKPSLKSFSDAVSAADRGEFFRLLKRQFGIVCICGALCCAGGFFLGTPVLGALYHKDISHLRLQLMLVIVGGTVYALCQLFYYVLVIFRKQRSIMLIYAAGSVATALLALALIPRHGLSGAAFSFLLSNCIVLLIYAAAAAAISRRHFDADKQ